MSCEPTHWLNWPMERTRPPCLCRKAGVQGSSKAWSFRPTAFFQDQEKIAKAQERGAPAGADGIEQVEDALLLDRSGHGNLSGIERGKAGANALGARDHAADARGQIVGALVAEHLQRHARRDRALECGVGGVLAPGLRERGQKSARGRAKAGASDVHVHRLAVDLRLGSCLRTHAGHARDNPALRES